MLAPYTPSFSLRWTPDPWAAMTSVEEPSMAVHRDALLGSNSGGWRWVSRRQAPTRLSKLHHEKKGLELHVLPSCCAQCLCQDRHVKDV
eukprot:scaffold297650_cov18-Tisochrysis_lutea.AAC.1